MNQPARVLSGFACISPLLLASPHAWCADTPAPATRSRPIDGILDNSFFVEEAYNQEPGMVQQIFNGVASWDKVRGPSDHSLLMTFTQEWPIVSQDHQFSYTIPYSFVDSGGVSENGVGDIFLNYRYQAYYNEETLRAFAPRASLILPTGNPNRGLGDDTVGAQFNLPYSQTFGDRWFTHFNSGLTFLPDSGAQVKADRLLYNFGASVIYAATPRLHFLVEWVGVWNDIPTAPGQTEREFESFISPGARYAFNFDNGSQLVLGAAVPVGLTDPTPNVGVFFYVSFEAFFWRPKSADSIRP